MAIMSNIAPPLVSGFVFQQYNLVPPCPPTRPSPCRGGWTESARTES